jgi:filamentous hemagglutinin
VKPQDFVALRRGHRGIYDAQVKLNVTQSAIMGMAGNTAARTGDAETGIKPIFDADRVQKEINAQTQITQLFGQQAPKAAAEFAQSQAQRLKQQARQAAQAGNTEEAQRLQREAKAWDEGGAYRVALHTVTGAWSGGTAGAAGALASASTAPLLNAFQDQLTQSLKDAGANDKVAQSAGQLIASLTVAGIGAAASGGSVAGAAVAFNIDANNRQLHPTEVQRIKQLAQGDKQKEGRLTAAACAMVRCADGIPTDDPNYAFLKALQDSGAGLQAEQALLNQQVGPVGRTLNQALFQYTPGQKLQDNWSANKMGTRTLGAAQGVAGVAGVIGSGALCTSGLGCAAGAITGTISADYAVAGVKQAATGNTQTPYGEQVLQSLGLSPEAAAWTYAALGLAPAGVEAVAVNRAVNLNTAANAWARGTYTGQSPITHEGRVYRFSDPKYANTTWEIYPGNVSTDMRYSEPGVGSIYSGTSVQTAAAEVMSYRDLSIGLFKPKSLVAGDVRIDNVLDLTDPAALKALGVTKDQITKSSHGANGAYTQTQKIAEWAREQGYNGILAPSAQNKSGTNLITFDSTVVTNVKVSPQPPVPPRFGRGAP